MKTWLIGVAVFLGLVFVVPDQVLAEGEGEVCLDCDERAFYEQGEPIVKHRFDSSGGSPRWCEEVGEEPDEGSPTAGPVWDGGCSSCHNDWVQGMCMFHDSCAEPGPVATEVDILVAALGSDGDGTDANPASELAIRISTISNLMPDHARGTLQLTDCRGKLVTEWNVPKTFLSSIAELK